MRFLAVLLLGATLASGQFIPGRYIVELEGEPLGALARDPASREAASDRRAAVRAEQQRAISALRLRGANVLSSMENVVNALVVKSDAEAAALAGTPGVKRVYPVYEVSTSLDRALQNHQVYDAWQRLGGPERSGAGVKIGIIDSGITPDHPGFQDPTLRAPAGYPMADTDNNRALTTGKIIAARSYEELYDDVEEDDTIRDRNGHGTFVAMIAAGAPHTAPFARISGVAPKAYLGVYKVFPLNRLSGSSDAIVNALDDALADGMDVVNMSLGSPFVFPLEIDIAAQAAERMTQYGVVVVVSAGNDGPTGSTIGNYGSREALLSVGATPNDRFLGGAVTLGDLGPLQAVPGSGPKPTGGLSGPLFDIEQLDPAGTACIELPQGSLAARIALVSRGTCDFATKLANVERAGGIGAVVYTTPTQPVVIMAVGESTLPAIMVSNQDGLALKARLAGGATPTVRVAFEGVSFTQARNRVATFSAIGPTYTFGLKPDLVATGQDVYSAAQRIDPDGELYDPSGYVSGNGTSFSAPMVAGVIALLKQGRPGLTAAQYRSLVTNSASPLILTGGGPAGVTQAGAGQLNAVAALENTVTVFPTSLTFSIGTTNLDDLRQLTITNVGRETDTFTLSTVRFGGAPAVRFSTTPSINATPDESILNDTLTLVVRPGQSRTVYANWFAPNLSTGDHQGQVIIRGTRTGLDTVVPYWYAVPSNTPATSILVTTPPTQARVGATLQLVMRVVDSAGIPITNPQSLGIRSTVVSGGGSVVNVLPASNVPGVLVAQVRLGTAPGTNVFRFQFGSLAPLEVSIRGVQ